MLSPLFLLKNTRFRVLLTIPHDTIFVPMEKLTNIEVQEYYSRILEYGECGLVGSTRSELRQLANEFSKLVTHNHNISIILLSSNPNYKYPPEYARKKLKYWLDRNSNYKNALYALGLVEAAYIAAK